MQGKLDFPSQILKTHVLRNLLSKYVAGTQDFGGKKRPGMSSDKEAERRLVKLL